jgi:murein DD-endopeptidase MepM/ murein hydrolase activator NlpD
MSIPSSLLANPALPAVNPQIERIRDGIAAAQGAEGEARLRELKKAAQEFEAVFIGYMLKVMRSTIEPAEEEGQSLGKDVYVSMFDQEIALQIARRNSLGIGEMMYRQLQHTVREKQGPQEPPPSEISPSLPAESVRPERLPPSQVDGTADFRQQSSLEGEELVRGWIAPVDGRLSSQFGRRADPFTQASRFHRGIDIAAPEGAPIRAVQAGTVLFSGYLRGYGNAIVVEHAGGYRTLYGHASRNLVKEGDPVSADQIIAEVGSSGRSTGTHLHFELQKGGEQLDPRKFLLAAGRSTGD